ncbi:MAG: penicillin-binding protein 1B [Cellvibrionaceae bacterium]|nr:penicillin-binding protein 1B [Cellvibrionaceae bacterium]
MPRKRRAAVKSRSAKKKTLKQWLLHGFFYLACRLFILAVIAACFYAAYLNVVVKAKFEGQKWSIPARVYGQPLELYEGLHISPQRLERELRALAYDFVPVLSAPGQVVRQGKRFQIYTQGFAFWDGYAPPAQYRLTLDKHGVRSLRSAGEVPVLRLEPREIGSIYPGHGEDRILTRLSAIPPLLGEALIVVEDKDFARHSGISLKAIARAFWQNIKAAGVVQGGSTITQQLVKNFYLNQRRSLWRKVQEAMMALLLEWHFSKADILEAYINEVYLGQSGPRAIHGFGLAAQHYFNRPLKALQPEHIALLVGVVKGASYYNPWRHPERATQRRNLVLQLMHEAQLLKAADYRRALRQPLGVINPEQRLVGDYPAFLDLVKRQLLRDYREADLHNEGLRIFTTLSPAIQQQTEAAVAKRVQQFNRDKTRDLQAAAVITAVGSGEVLALVGDRSPRYSGFNRALDAQRQIGSLVKPFVYLTALMQPQDYHLTTRLDDASVTVDLPGGDLWQPQNFDQYSHGQVLLYQALAFSYNQATARLGMALGVNAVIDTLQRAGLQSQPQALPSLLLGALALSPLEVSHLYHTLAADGVYTPLRAIRSVLNADNQALQRYPLRSETRFDEDLSHLMHFALQAVMRIGTGRAAYAQLSSELSVAGKTGTTNDYRDSWFAGYSGDHLGVVWLGHDDNRPTGLTGSTGALKVWADIFGSLATTSLSQNTPATIEYYWMDGDEGLRSAQSCKGALLVPFVAGSQPRQKTPCRRRSRSFQQWFNQWFR